MTLITTKNCSKCDKVKNSLMGIEVNTQMFGKVSSDLREKVRNFFNRK